MKLATQLRAEFMAEAEAVHRPASQVLRELMREFVQHQREAREYDTFLHSKVELARTSMQAGLGWADRMMRLKPHLLPDVLKRLDKDDTHLDARGRTRSRS